jgi:ferredoxin-NADP reductase
VSTPAFSLVTLPVRSVARATRRAALLTLAVEDGAYRFAPGHAVMLGAHGGESRKPYSIASSPADARDRGVLEFLVGTDGDDVGSHMPDLSVGAFIDVEGPFGSLVLPDPVDAPRLLLLAGGTGIAPMRSMWRHLLGRGTGPRITLVYSVRTLEDVAFADEIAELVARERMEAVVTLSRDVRARPPQRAGRIDLDLLRSVAGPGDAFACVCGPPGFVAHIVAALDVCGLPAGRILSEGW